MLFAVWAAKAQTTLESVMKRAQELAKSGSSAWLDNGLEGCLTTIDKTHRVWEGLDGLHKTDSIEGRSWDATTQSWGPVHSKLYYEFDCGLGKRLSLITKQFDGSNFNNSFKLEYEYHPDGTLKSRKQFSTDLFGDWVETIHAEYLPSGKITEEWNFTIVQNGVPQSGEKTTHHYDAQEKVSLEELSKWNAALAAWELSDRYSYTYNGQGNLAERLHESNASGSWVEVGRWLHSYDTSDRISQVLAQLYYVGNGWVDSYRTTYSYSTGGNPASSLYEEYIFQQWLTRSRKTYSYDGAGSITEVLTESYFQPDWQNDTLQQFSYYPNGALNTERLAFWDQAWVETNFRSLDMDGNNLIYENKYGYNGAFFNDGIRFTNTWYANQVASSLQEKLESNTLDEWKPSYLTTYTFDGGDLALQETFQIWDETANGFLNVNLGNYFNSDCLVGSATESGKAGGLPLCTFANPCQPGQSLQCGALEGRQGLEARLYTLGGHLVSRQGVELGAFNVSSGVPPGLYCLAIHDGDGIVFRAKLVVQ